MDRRTRRLMMILLTALVLATAGCGTDPLVAKGIKLCQQTGTGPGCECIIPQYIDHGGSIDDYLFATGGVSGDAPLHTPSTSDLRRDSKALEAGIISCTPGAAQGGTNTNGGGTNTNGGTVPNGGMSPAPGQLQLGS